jgi:ribosomal-protein-alanine N-acetyltransferase
MAKHWPIVLQSNEIRLQPLRFRDRRKWAQVRAENRDWLSPWEATLPHVPGYGQQELPSFLEMLRVINSEANDGRSYSLMVWHENNLIGQITMGGIIYGAMRGAHIGYWIDRNYAGRGYTTSAVDLLTSFGFNELKLHRIEINVRPENAASIRVAEKAGYIFEGVRPRYLHIDGAWRDHHCFVKENTQII